MGPSRYDHLNFFTFQLAARIGLRAGCLILKKTIGGTLRATKPFATSIDRAQPYSSGFMSCMPVSFQLSALTPTPVDARGSRQESFRVISTARLRTLPPVHLPPINVVVSNDPKGDLILRLASCLDAFSTYPYPTRLPGRAPGGTTGWPEVGPTRSSRTSVRSPQISSAHNR